MYDNIMVPLDGSSLAEAILPYVSRLASGLNAKVILLTTIDPESPAFLGGKKESDGGALSREQKLERSKTQARDYLTNLQGKLAVDVEFLVSEGSPAQCIIEEQERHGSDLIAMSTHGRTGIARGIIGSVTDKVIHASGGPVLVVRTEEEQEQPSSLDVNSLIVPLDGSDLSESVLPHAEELAKRLSLELILVEAINVKVQDVYFGGGFYVDPTPLEEELVKGAEKYLEEVSQRLRSNGVNVRWKTLLDVPAIAVAQFARETPNSIIAMSTRGRSGFTRWIVGSVTEKVVREAGVAVLIVPPSQ